MVLTLPKIIQKNIYKFLFIVLFPCVIIAQKDSLKLNHLMVYTSPSQILFGDVPLGLEHRFSKKISHELFLQFKVSGPILNLFNFNRGYGLNYFLKYDFINSRKNTLSFDLGYSYTKSSFENKKDIDPLFRIYGNVDIPRQYNMSVSRISSAIITGISFNREILRRIYTGANFLFECGKNKLNYEINDQNFKTDYATQVPYYLETKNFYYRINFIIKIGYKIY